MLISLVAENGPLDMPRAIGLRQIAADPGGPTSAATITHGWEKGQDLFASPVKAAFSTFTAERRVPYFRGPFF